MGPSEDKERNRDRNRGLSRDWDRGTGTSTGTGVCTLDAHVGDDMTGAITYWGKMKSR
jgi:hypothetical protein